MCLLNIYVHYTYWVKTEREREREKSGDTTRKNTSKIPRLFLSVYVKH